MNKVKELQKFLVDKGPPRPGLVPQSGNPEHPGRWVRPEEGQKPQQGGRAKVPHPLPGIPDLMTPDEMMSLYDSMSSKASYSQFTGWAKQHLSKPVNPKDVDSVELHAHAALSRLGADGYGDYKAFSSEFYGDKTLAPERKNLRAIARAVARGQDDRAYDLIEQHLMHGEMFGPDDRGSEELEDAAEDSLDGLKGAFLPTAKIEEEDLSTKALEEVARQFGKPKDLSIRMRGKKLDVINHVMQDRGVIVDGDSYLQGMSAKEMHDALLEAGASPDKRSTTRRSPPPMYD